jgi:L-rhamnose mutarotase
MKRFGLVACICLLMIGCSTVRPATRRFGQLGSIRSDRIERFKEICAAMGPAVSETLKTHHFHNYSIYMKDLKEDEFYLFSYFEYTGNDHDGDMGQIEASPIMQQWNAMIEDECLAKISPDDSRLWTDMEEVFYYDGADDVKADERKVQRYGMVIGVKPEMVESYKYIHANPWPEVLAAIKEGNLRNYPIYMTTIDDRFYIFGYFEYIGNDFGADMTMVDTQPATIAWMKFTDNACQLPIPTRAEGEWWASMEQIFLQK